MLTALAAAGLAGTPGERTSSLRLIAMITARYDWGADRVAVGQEELGRLWGTSLRTAKREMKRLTGSGVLVCLAPGVRGRVGTYRLDPAALRRLTEGAWPRVGAEFEDRMRAAGDAEAVPGAVQVERAADGGSGGGGLGDAGPRDGGLGDGGEGDRVDGEAPEWTRLRRRLRAEDPAAFAAWFARLTFAGRDGDEVRVRAPSRFVASYVETHLAAPLSAAARACFGAETRLVLCAG